MNIITTHNNKILVANYSKKYEGRCLMVSHKYRRLRQIEKDLDTRLTVLDELRCKTEKVEKSVLELIQEQRLLQEKLNIKN